MIWRPWKHIRELKSRDRYLRMQLSEAALLAGEARRHASNLGAIELASDPLRELLSMPVMLHTVDAVMEKATEEIVDQRKRVHKAYLSQAELIKLHEINKRITRYLIEMGAPR